MLRLAESVFARLNSSDSRHVSLSSIFTSKIPASAGLGIGIFFLSVSTIAYQDIAGFGPGALSDNIRWTAYNIEVETGSTWRAQMGGGVDRLVTGTVQKKPQMKTFGGRPGHPGDRQKSGKGAGIPVKINRTLKGDRVISSSVKRPPANFSAGSVIEKSSLLRGAIDQSRAKPVFARSRTTSEPVRMARAFYQRKAATRKIFKTLSPKTMVAAVKTRLKGTGPTTTLVAYAPQNDSGPDPFKSLFKNTGDTWVKPILGLGDHKWAANRLPASVNTRSEQRCLANGIYFEARGESVQGQAAVAQVILNRVKNPSYPNTICRVVYQNKSWKNRCQFSFACDGIRDRVNSSKNWKTAVAIAKKTSLGQLWSKVVGSATHYHAVYVRPRWARSMKRMGRIGRHIFYRTYGGGWS